ncbi:VPLPA-CTERM sorting domain-containing protein [Meridianimarinicoccus aquatilis]|uniref:VPLPA-CTERM sorting domain-containing protein n=1 Tax=Meridianimarinicoccus aquatilis TaxID=2552766 RepID=A0A4R6AT61_9RHOB|nr:VPLPA-CTERM sorting domain-containing protein [Fluviibacterium aquatile]QIE42208.1 VPLPA-CTERM sorting domain-containing protein [Rhodobacteraceae bacterium SC52]TDL86802.1 VPLPA-CTERM sorting domain-containing protein [Fluviibacterium aquatile]
MEISRLLKGAVTALGLSLASISAHAAPVLDGGWFGDDVQDTNTASDFSPYTFTLLADAWFRITDAFLTGDKYTVFETGSTTPLLTTALFGFSSGFGDNTTADFGWTSASHESAEILLSAGSYSLEVFGDCGGGCPAGFYTRLDSAMPTVPVPAALPLLLGGIATMGALRRTKRKS